MAVHNRNATQSNDASKLTEPDLSKAAPDAGTKRTRTMFGEVPYGTNQANTGQQAELLRQVFAEIISNNGDNLATRFGISHKIIPIKAGTKGGRNPLISDSVVIAFTKNNHTVVSSIILADTDTPIQPLSVLVKGRSIYQRDNTLSITRTMRDLDSRVYREYISSLFTDKNGEVTIARSTVISAELAKVDNKVIHSAKIPVDINATVLRVIQSCMIKLGVEKLEEYPDISVDDVISLGGCIGLDVSEDSGNTTTYDGVIINSKRKMSFTVRDKADVGNNGRLDVHNAQGASPMGTVNLSTEVRHLIVPPTQNTQFGLGSTAPAYPKSWAPTVIIDSIDMPNNPSAGVVALMVATVSGFMTPDIMMSMYDNTIRYLSIISNVTMARKPEPVTLKAINSDFRQVYSALFCDTFTIGLRVRPGTTSFITDVDWLKLAEGSKDPYILKHLAKELGVQSVPPHHIINQHIDVHPTGVIQVDKGVIPASDVDIRYLLEHYPDETEIHHEWLRACTGMLSREERLAIKTRIIRDTVGNLTVTGTDYIVYFDGNAINALRSKLISSVTLAPNNIMTSGFEDLSWAGHGAGNIGMTFNMSSQSAFI